MTAIPVQLASSFSTFTTETYFKINQPSFLCVSCPSSGKTNFSLGIASHLLNQEKIEQLIVVVPTEHLKHQWTTNSKKFGIELNPKCNSLDVDALRESTDAFDGVCATFSQISSNWEFFACLLKKRTLVIIDEVHHLGSENSWGDCHNRAFEKATRKLLLSGTPFRSDSIPISFVQYDEENTCIADFSYSLSEALRDGIVRELEFITKNGAVSWDDSQTIHSTCLNNELSDYQRGRAVRTALAPKLPFISQLLKEADKKLDELRKDHYDAGGLIIASDIAHATELKNILESVNKLEVLLVTSKDPSSSSIIEKFEKGQGKWLVTVKMVSEGVDIPRLRVLVYATSIRTEMFFQQAVGRVIRTTNDPPCTNANMEIPQTNQIGNGISFKISLIGCISPPKILNLT